MVSSCVFCENLKSESIIILMNIFLLVSKSPSKIEDDITIAFELVDGSRVYVGKAKAEKMKLRKTFYYNATREVRSNLYTRYTLEISGIQYADGNTKQCVLNTQDAECTTNASIILL